MSAAETTLIQLGGYGRLTAMFGATSFLLSGDVLYFRFKAKAKNGSNTIQVTLEPSDTYTVEFFSVRAGKRAYKGVFTDVYADQLKGLIERETGLYLSL
jgi:hypothetical protein